LTLAASTPGMADTAFSMVMAQSPQSIPSMVNSMRRFSALVSVLAILCVLCSEYRALSRPFDARLAIPDVPQADRQQCCDVVVVQGMVNNLAFAPALDQPQAAQHTQVLGHGGLADVRDGRQV